MRAPPPLLLRPLPLLLPHGWRCPEWSSPTRSTCLLAVLADTGEEDEQARPLVSCGRQPRASLLPDLLRCFSTGRRRHTVRSRDPPPSSHKLPFKILFGKGPTMLMERSSHSSITASCSATGLQYNSMVQVRL